MFYVISPPGRTGWRFDDVDLAVRLRRDWEGVVVDEHPSIPQRHISWSIRAEGDELRGWQDSSGEAQYLEGPNFLIARYAAWWRAQVEPREALLLYDEGYSQVVELSPGIQADEVSGRLGS